jgi:hypothetical protein
MTDLTHSRPSPSALLPGEACHSNLCEVRRSGIHGRGLFATERIDSGSVIIEYIGERISKKESLKRGWAQLDHAAATGGAAVYIFTLTKKWDLDGNCPENSARLINHSCDPNCESYMDKGKIWIAALRVIEEGDELYFNYGFDLDTYQDHPCYCGSPKCVGHIAGEEYWPSLRRKLGALKGWERRRAKL